MSKQIFRQNIPSDYLFNLLEQICLKTEHYYVVDYNSYRKLLFYNLDEKLSTDMMEYYHLSKQFYVTRKMTYKSFTNIIRHICKNINVVCTSQMKYHESKYSDLDLDGQNLGIQVQIVSDMPINNNNRRW
jgi:hypothetical protein